MTTIESIPELERGHLRTLFTNEMLEERTKELANQISNDYKENSERDLILICILNGAAKFHSDLAKEIDFDPKRLLLDYMRVQSYDGENSSGEPKITADTKNPVKDCDIVIVEDIVDTGYSMKKLMDILTVRGANSIEICALFSKPERREVEGINIKYLGFEIPNKYIFGRGLDDGKERYRSLEEVVCRQP